MELFETVTLKLSRLNVEHDYPYHESSAFDINSKWFIWGHRKNIFLWDLESNYLANTYSYDRGKFRLEGIVISSENNSTAILKMIGQAHITKLYLWNIGKSEPFLILEGEGYGKFKLSIAAKKIIGTKSSEIIVIDIETKQTLILSGHQDYITKFNFVSENSIVTGSNDNSIHLWKLNKIDEGYIAELKWRSHYRFFARHCSTQNVKELADANIKLLQQEYDCEKIIL